MSQIDEWTGNGWPQGLGSRMRHAPNIGTQARRVLDYMREHKSITSREAMEMDIYRLAARVNDLRRDGWQIKTIPERHNGGRHARYELEKSNPLHQSHNG